MKRPTQSIWFWTPRILLALLWIIYVYPFVHGVFAFPDFWREGLIGVVISIALGGVLLGALALAIEVVQQERLAGAMRRPVRRLLFWTPRVALLLFAAFLSIFALDVFGAGYGFWETALALLIHLIPVWIMFGALALAWRWEWVGALILMVVWPALYFMMMWERFDVMGYLQFAGLPFVLGLLFLLNWRYHAEVRASSHAPRPS